MSEKVLQFENFDRLSKEDIVELVAPRASFSIELMEEAAWALHSGNFFEFREYLEERYNMPRSPEFWSSIADKFVELRRECNKRK